MTGETRFRVTFYAHGEPVAEFEVLSTGKAEAVIKADAENPGLLDNSDDVDAIQVPELRLTRDDEP
jgi:hypothetical protein